MTWLVFTAVKEFAKVMIVIGRCIIIAHMAIVLVPSLPSCDRCRCASSSSSPGHRSTIGCCFRCLVLTYVICKGD